VVLAANPNVVLAANPNVVRAESFHGVGASRNPGRASAALTLGGAAGIVTTP
jgi:hypothetical protein